MTETNTLADCREGEAMAIVSSLGLPYHYRLSPDAQAVVDAAATGSPVPPGRDTCRGTSSTQRIPERDNGKWGGAR